MRGLHITNYNASCHSRHNTSAFASEPTTLFKIKEKNLLGLVPSIPSSIRAGKEKLSPNCSPLASFKTTGEIHFNSNV